jgi:hypothetical protein
MRMIAMAALLLLVAAPLACGLLGWRRMRGAPASAGGGATADLRTTLASTLLYVLAFNLTFFVQELFLVLPKAFLPGLEVTLFHNNHAWKGEHPLAALFQGGGAAATLLEAAVCAALLRYGGLRAGALRLLLAWMAYCGAFMALPQVVVGALSAASDVGMAMAYLQLGPAAKGFAALLALAAMPPIAVLLLRPLLALADDAACIADAAARTRFVFRIATAPALIAIVPIVAFRVPREWTEVVLPPLAVSLLGVPWMQAAAWRVEGVNARGSATWPIAWPLAADAFVLLLFQLALRPGIRFF